jgi:hypothetical protein
MKLFDKNGIMIIPVPEKHQAASKEIIVIKDCFCPNGHKLVNRRARFGDYDGIIIGVNQYPEKGLIALSPVFGDKSKISIDIDLKEGALLDLVCPVCDVRFPVYSNCECGGEIMVMFTKPEKDFMNCVGICNRVGCKHAEIKNEGQLMTLIQGD